jgi:hypothetical protein
MTLEKLFNNKGRTSFLQWHFQVPTKDKDCSSAYVFLCLSVICFGLDHHIRLTLPIISDELLCSPAFHTPYSPIEDYIPMIPAHTEQTDVMSLTALDEQPINGAATSLCTDFDDWKLPSDGLLTDSESNIPATSSINQA